MDYSSSESIKDAGRKAFSDGLELKDCPISRRTNANAIHYWNFGWHDEKNNTCKGKNCKSKKGIGHSDECKEEREAQYTVN